MRVPLVVLVLAFAAVQSITLVDCCCGSLCPHQDRRCTGCGDETECTLGAPSQSEKPPCCNTETPSAPSSHEKGCSHVNPSVETLLQTPEVDLQPPDAPIVVLCLPETGPEAAAETEGSPARDRPRREPDRPVYLRLHAFLI